MASKPKKKSAKSIAGGAVEATTGVAGSIFRVLGTILLILLVTGLLFLCIFAYYVKNCLSTELDVALDDFTLSLSSSILYQDGDDNWQNLVTLSGTENRIWVDYADIPKAMEHAAVAIEDRRFYEHKGVDWYRTSGAFVNMFLSMKNDFGGSTITQQLIKNLTKQDDITVQRKLLEIFQALEFEKSYDKDEIIEWYLNVVYFGEGCNGIYTAAETYFGKEPSELSLAECASIIGITNNPSKYDPFISEANNKARQETILWEMYDQGYIQKDQYDAAVAEKLVFARGVDESATQTIYSYYAEAVIEDVLQDLMEQKGVSYDTARTLLYSGGYQIYSCYNPRIQDIVDEYYTDLEKLPQRASAKGQQFESAIVILDPYTGEVQALSGGTGEKTINFGLNRATQAKRPPGSSFKPIATYGPAMELGLITQYTQVNDSPNIKLSGTSWYPKTPAAATTACSPSARGCSARSTPFRPRFSTSSPRARRLSFFRTSSASRAWRRPTATTRRSPSGSSPTASPCAKWRRRTARLSTTVFLPTRVPIITSPIPRATSCSKIRRAPSSRTRRTPPGTWPTCSSTP